MSNTSFINKNCIRKWRPYVLLTELEVRKNKASKIFITSWSTTRRAGKETSWLLKFRGPYSRIRPATDQSQRAYKLRDAFVPIVHRFCAKILLNFVHANEDSWKNYYKDKRQFTGRHLHCEYVVLSGPKLCQIMPDLLGYHWWQQNNTCKRTFEYPDLFSVAALLKIQESQNDARICITEIKPHLGSCNSLSWLFHFFS